MSDDIRSVAQEHQAFYEVYPYYVAFERRQGKDPATTHTIQAGFEVDVYGVNLRKQLTMPGENPDYAVGYSELKKMAQGISEHCSDSCSLEVLESPSEAFIDPQHNYDVEGQFQIIISHQRGVDKPAGPAEQHALEELENELRSIGVNRRGKAAR